VTWYSGIWPDDCVKSIFVPKLPDFLRKQHATRSGGGNGDVSVNVRVSSALRLASDRRGQNTVFCLLLTKQATKATGDARRCSLLNISIYARYVSLLQLFFIFYIFVTNIYKYVHT